MTETSRKTQTPMTCTHERTKYTPTTGSPSRDGQAKWRHSPTPTAPLNHINMRSKHSRRHSTTDIALPTPRRHYTYTTHGTVIHTRHHTDTISRGHPLTHDTISWHTAPTHYSGNGHNDTNTETQKHSSPAGVNMTTAVDVVCPRRHIADFVYFRCATCKYFAIHQRDTPDKVLCRIYGVMSPDTLYQRQGSWQDAELSPTPHTCSAPPPQVTTPKRIPPRHATNGWVHDVTKDGNVEPNPGPTSPAGPSPKCMRYNRDVPSTHNTPTMIHKRPTDTPIPADDKGRRTELVEKIVREPQQTQTHEYTSRKRKAEDLPPQKPPQKRQTNASHLWGQHASETQENTRPKRPYEDTTMHDATTISPNKKICKTQWLRIRFYPRSTRWLHDPTQDGDTEPKPGPLPTTRVDEATQTTTTVDSGRETHDLPPPPPTHATSPLRQGPANYCATQTEYRILGHKTGQEPRHNPTPRTPETREQHREDCPKCMEQLADTDLSCHPRHKLCLTCANDPRLLRCPLCRRTREARIRSPPPFDDPTYEHTYIHTNIQEPTTHVRGL